MNTRFSNETDIRLTDVTLQGELIIPIHAETIVIFSHGSGSSRFSTRNRMVASYLHQKNFGTLLFDLLTQDEDREYSNRFDIDLLTGRLIGVTQWLQTLHEAQKCAVCYFGASTGAASALKAAAAVSKISAVVSRGGRPDLARDDLSRVKAPTLLIVGSLDQDVLQLNQSAFQQLKCEKDLVVIQGATHLFEEEGTMDEVCKHAAAWFEKYGQAVTSSH